MRLLHTSDWHLGATLDGVSREPDHARFLDWLLETLEHEEVDVLVVAGDVFDIAQPSAEAQRQYYRFLARAAASRMAGVVVVGGNHDSASRLDAPAEVLGSLDVHVVGGLEADPERWDRCLLPIRDGDGRVMAVVAAVPFVHEYRLGVRATRGDEKATRHELRLAFTRLYRRLADRASGRWPGVPLIATGHLTAVGATPDDYITHIHQVDRAGTLPASIFDRRFSYVALGHIHRAFAVGDRPVWYSGSPVPLRLKEAETPRHVLLVDIAADGEARVERREVPRFRDLVLLEGDRGQVEEGLAALSSDAPLPPIVYARVTVDGYDPGVQAALQEVLAQRDDGDDARPHLAGVRQQAAAPVAAPSPVADDEGLRPSLRDLTPEDVFRRLCADRGEPLEDDLLAAFRDLVGGPSEALGPAPEVRATPQQVLLLPPEPAEEP
ncbi:MAG: exonuclease subunit SbcD [Deltaproteobacteria bacterium]|nr:MAG: exonuclease subunit SbcD [Deltaproteobacteria bacterium]